MSSWFRTYGFADVVDGLLIGAYPLDADDVRMLTLMRVKRIMNLTEDQEYRPGERKAVEEALSAAGIEERRVAFTDYGGLPPEDLEGVVQEVSRWLDDGACIYLHCRAGWQRAAAVAAGVVALRAAVDIDDALAYVQARKPTADPLPHQREDLRRWWQGHLEQELEGRGEPSR
jgi:protein-tyrosine phosphatase